MGVASEALPVDGAVPVAVGRSLPYPARRVIASILKSNGYALGASWAAGDGGALCSVHIGLSSQKTFVNFGPEPVPVLTQVL